MDGLVTATTKDTITNKTTTRTITTVTTTATTNTIKNDDHDHDHDNKNNDKKCREMKGDNSPNSGKGGKHKARMTQDARLRGDVLIVIQAVLLPATCLITLDAALCIKAEVQTDFFAYLVLYWKAICTTFLVQRVELKYGIAIFDNHVDTLTLISYTGTWPPESCVFSFLLVCYSICAVIAVYGRWRMTRMYDTNNLCRRLNNGALGVGFTAALGVFIVATFQITNVQTVHHMGALLAFYLANIYMWMQSYITRRVPAIPGFVAIMFIIRLGISIIATSSAILVPVFFMLVNARYDGNVTQLQQPGSIKWESYMNGYDMHVAGLSAEWTLAFSASFFFLTFIREFRHIYFGMPLVNLSDAQYPEHDLLTSDVEKRSYQGLSQHYPDDDRNEK